MSDPAFGVTFAPTISVKKLSLPTKVLFVFTFAWQFVSVFYAAWETQNAAFELLSRLAFVVILGWWLKEDMRRTTVRWPPIDLGLFIYVAGFVLIPYHLFATRGVRGFLGILSFIAVNIAGWLAATVLILLIWFR